MQGLELPEGVEEISLLGLRSADGLELPAGVRFVYLNKGLVEEEKQRLTAKYPGKVYFR